MPHAGTVGMIQAFQLFHNISMQFFTFIIEKFLWCRIFSGKACILPGLDVDKNAIQRMESGSRFITDIELKIIAHVLQVSYTELLDGEE